MDKYLIINADDFGMCHAANAATIDLFEKGGITSATVMTPCPWAPEALRFAQAHPEYAIGVHITFTSEWRKYCWRPVSQSPCPSLRDHRGYMHFHCDDFEKNAKTAEVEEEMNCSGCGSFTAAPLATIIPAALAIGKKRKKTDKE